MLWLSVTFLAFFASVQGRAVNISNTWVLPEEGFPVFYRYFRDRISWYEADAVCQFHHANLVTVDTTAQYDAVRAYLKELDISSAVWVGLIRSNPDGDFTWTDYRALSSEGYWSSAPDPRAAPLCAAADPAADYRWEARTCGGPTVASFICELPVPQWALESDGCMVRALPALTVLYLPESAAVQLTADCGLAGVKRVQCTGSVKHEELLKDLSCNDEDDPAMSLSLSSTTTVWSVTDTLSTDLEVTTDEQTTEVSIITDYKEASKTATRITETPTPSKVNFMSVENGSTNPKLNINDYNKILLSNEVNLEQIHSNNIVSNDIPNQENSINHQNPKEVDENKSLKHKLLHDEMTRLGNLETIFTQPTDHFVPPLVMAKARVSEDMTVLSLEEKHAQQIAEQRIHKHNRLIEHANMMSSHTSNPVSTTLMPIKIVKQDTVMPAQSLQNNNKLKKDMKSSVPKKYIEKYHNPKAQLWRTVDHKIQKAEKLDELSTMETLSTTKRIEVTTEKTLSDYPRDSEEDSIIDLTVIIKEPGVENGQKIFYSNHSDSILKIELTANVTDASLQESDIKYSTTDKDFFTTNPATEVESQATSKIVLNNEIIKITVINDQINTGNSTPIVFEVSTMTPVLNNSSEEVKDSLSDATTTGYPSSPTFIKDTLISTTIMVSSRSNTQTPQSDPVSVSTDDKHVTGGPSTTNNIDVTNIENIVSSAKTFVTTQPIMNDTITVATTTMSVDEKKTTENVHKDAATTVNLPVNITEIIVTEKHDVFNHTEHTEEEQEQDESDLINDYQSPLLSAANEPLHRPNRSRRPQAPPNRMNKFNPFRILG